MTTLHLTIYGDSIADWETDAMDEQYIWRDGISTRYGAAHPITESGYYYDTVFNGVHNVCDSIYRLRVVIGKEAIDIVKDTACDSILWREMKFYESGTYYDTVKNAIDGVSDSIYRIDLVIYNAGHRHYTEVACDTFFWHGSHYSITGDYYFNRYDSNGCYVTDTLHLTVYSDSLSPIDTVLACATHEWRGYIFDTTGFYVDTVHGAVHGVCDSVYQLDLSVNYTAFTGISHVTVCDYTLWRGGRYDETGTYYDTVFSDASDICDSIYILEAIVNKSSHNADTAEACHTYEWHDYTYENAGSYLYMYDNEFGCQSVDTLYLTLYRLTYGIDPQTVCNSYTWNDSTYDVTGVYTDTLHSIHGCDSVVSLILTVYYDVVASSSPMTACDFSDWRGNRYYESGTYYDTIEKAANYNLCDSIYKLELTVNYGTFTGFHDTACNTYQWNGVEYTLSGTYPYMYTNAYDCQSIDTLYLVVNRGVFESHHASNCNYYVWHDSVYEESGIYVYDYATAANCPSSDTLYLDIRKSTHDTLTVKACDNFWWNNKTYDTTGIYIYDYINAASCESSDTLWLTVNYSSHQVDTITACDSMMWHGITYKENGAYWFDYENEDGCASSDTLRLVIHQSVHNSETRVAANYYEWHGTVYFASGTYLDKYTTEDNCEGVDTLHLIITTSSNSAIEVTICEGYTWNNVHYTHSGTYTYNYIDAAGVPSCDTLYLTVLPSYHNTTKITTCNMYSWNGNTYTMSGIYSRVYMNEFECESYDTLDLTINYSNFGIDERLVCDSLKWIDGNTYYDSTTAPTFVISNSKGCDSTVNLHLMVYYSASSVVYDSFCVGTEYIFNGVSYTIAGHYVDSLKTVDGCDSLAGLELTRLNIPPLTLEYDYSCDSQTYTLTANTNVDYIFWNASPDDSSLRGHEYDSQIVVKPTKVTTYTVYADYREQLLCPTTRELTVTPILVPKAGIEMTPTFVTEDNRNFFAIDTSKYNSSRKWLIDDVELSSTEARIDAMVPKGLDSVTVSLEVSNGLCYDTAHVVVPVIHATFYAPNVFTPTEETNSGFKVFIEGVEEFEISIYNRQGLLVYRSTDITEVWDGNHWGKPCQQAAYVYTVHYTDRTRPGVWQKYVGTVLLLR